MGQQNRMIWGAGSSLVVNDPTLHPVSKAADPGLVGSGHRNPQDGPPTAGHFSIKCRRQQIHSCFCEPPGAHALLVQIFQRQ